MILDLYQIIDNYSMNITGVIHIGAHHGQEIEVYAKIPSIKHVLAFEPHPDTFNVLEENTAHLKDKFDNFFIINKALGPFKCKIDIYEETSNNGQSNSVLCPKDHCTQYPHIIFSSMQEISMDPLDRYEPSKEFNFINIDVQGFELEVFRGARKTLKNIDYIMTEVNRAELYENCALVEDIDEYLGKFGFERVETVWAGQTWGDSLYISTHLLG